MKEKKPYLYLNAFLAKNECSSLKESDFLKKSSQVKAYDIDNKHELEGPLCQDSCHPHQKH